jgi:Ice-binding-like
MWTNNFARVSRMFLQNFFFYCCLSSVIVACDSPTEVKEVQAVTEGDTLISVPDTTPFRVLATTPFRVLANTAITCTNGNITGDVGTFRSPAEGGTVTLTSCPTIASHVGTVAAKQTFSNFVTSYNVLATAACDRVLTGTLAGVTLPPGVYCFDAAATLTGTLTLNGPADGRWLFKIGTIGGALTGTNFTVLTTGGAQPCNVIWWVRAAATMTDSYLIGHVLAGTAVTLTNGVFAGNAWAQSDVTVTNTLTAECGF